MMFLNVLLLTSIDLQISAIFKMASDKISKNYFIHSLRTKWFRDQKLMSKYNIFRSNYVLYYF